MSNRCDFKIGDKVILVMEDKWSKEARLELGKQYTVKETASNGEDIWLHISETFYNIKAEQFILAPQIKKENMQQQFNITKEKILEHYRCSSDEVKKYLREHYPAAFEVDKSVDTSGFKGFPSTGYPMIANRSGGNHVNNAFFLSDEYNWEIREEQVGKFGANKILIPTKK
jgi:hypothetical protein